MTRQRRSSPPRDADLLAMQHASRVVGLQIAGACAAIVVALVTTVFLYIISQINPAELFETTTYPNVLDVDAIPLLGATVVLGGVLIILAGLLSRFVTRRAVQPLGDALRIQRSFVADASHELRTPLTVLDARLQILQRSLPEDDPSRPVVVELRQDTKSLIETVNDLLATAEDIGSGSTAGSANQLDPAIELAVASMRLLANEKSVAITVRQPASIWTSLPPVSAHRCILALLDNALRFSPVGSRIEITAGVHGSMATVSVRDHGGGVQGIDPARIFDRFAHSGNAIGGGGNTRIGFGIGLALVRDLVIRAGGSVRVIDTSPTGTTIAFSVPALRAP